ncbi:MAG: trigger factor [Arsenophonus sp.]
MYQKKVLIDGFYKGKAPMNMLNQHYGISVLQNLLDDINAA